MMMMAMVVLSATACAQGNLMSSESSTSSAEITAHASVLIQRENKFNVMAPEKKTEPKEDEKVAAVNVVKTHAADAALDVKGYEQMVGTKDTAQMNAYIRRLVDVLGLRLADEKELSVLSAQHLGKKQSNFSNLVDDVLLAVKEHKGIEMLLKAADGATAPLNKYGFQDVLKYRSNDEMGKFIVRVADVNGVKIDDPGFVAGIAAYYSGMKGIQSFDRLTEELREYSKKMGAGKSTNDAADESLDSDMKKRKKDSLLAVDAKVDQAKKHAEALGAADNYYLKREDPKHLLNYMARLAAPY